VLLFLALTYAFVIQGYNEILAERPDLKAFHPLMRLPVYRVEKSYTLIREWSTPYEETLNKQINDKLDQISSIRNQALHMIARKLDSYWTMITEACYNVALVDLMEAVEVQADFKGFPATFKVSKDDLEALIQFLSDRMTWTIAGKLYQDQSVPKEFVRAYAAITDYLIDPGPLSNLINDEIKAMVRQSDDEIIKVAEDYHRQGTTWRSAVRSPVFNVAAVKILAERIAQVWEATIPDRLLSPN